MTRRAVVLGGGAAGFFGAIHAAEGAPDAEVRLLEATRSPLQKVRISGGGRCNVTHDLQEPGEFVKRYPRGAKELRGALARFGPGDTVDWFHAHGVPLRTEADGRMFPVTDSSETVIDALQRAAADAGVVVEPGTTVTAAVRDERGFQLTLKDGRELDADAFLVATGSNPHGLALARVFGHTLVPGVPSLFTFNVDDPRLSGLAGVSVPLARASLLVPDEKPLTQEGALLVTHWGLSAPAVLRLSAWGARALHASGYAGTLLVDWVPAVTDAELRARAAGTREAHPRGTIGAHSLAPEVPRRLWERLLAHAGVDPETRWSEVPKKGLSKAILELKRGEYRIRGKGPFKEEFVTAGGVERKEVDWRTMESRRVPGLHFAGEVLDVDGLTGGFNFQNAWTTGWIAGTTIGERLHGKT